MCRAKDLFSYRHHESIPVHIEGQVKFWYASKAGEHTVLDTSSTTNRSSTSNDSTCIINPMLFADLTPPVVIQDDFTENLLALHAEFGRVVDEMTEINATSAAAAHFAAQRTCERFLTHPALVEASPEPSHRLRSSA